MDYQGSHDAGVISLLNDFADILIINFLWLVTSLPVFTLGASTAAVYSVMRSPGDKRYTSSLVVLYFRSFARNFKKATVIFLLLLIPWAFVIVNAFLLFYGLLEAGIAGYVICGLSFILFVSLWVYVFPLVATFENGALKTVGNALVLSVAHFPTTILVILMSALPLLVLLFYTNFFFKTVFFWVFIVVALISKADALLVERVLKRYIPAEG